MSFGRAEKSTYEEPSAEPIALEGQHLITRERPVKGTNLQVLEGRLVVAVDESGARYFKRLRCRSDIVVLESLNPDGVASSELLSWDGKNYPRITEAVEVVGVLFELPDVPGVKGKVLEAYLRHNDIRDIASPQTAQFGRVPWR